VPSAANEGVQAKWAWSGKAGSQVIRTNGHLSGGPNAWMAWVLRRSWAGNSGCFPLSKRDEGILWLRPAQITKWLFGGFDFTTHTYVRTVLCDYQIAFYCFQLVFVVVSFTLSICVSFAGSQAVPLCVIKHFS